MMTLPAGHGYGDGGPLFVGIFKYYLYSQGHEEEGAIWKAENGRQTTKKGAMEV